MEIDRGLQSNYMSGQYAEDDGKEGGCGGRDRYTCYKGRRKYMMDDKTQCEVYRVRREHAAGYSMMDEMRHREVYTVTLHHTAGYST